MDENEKLYDIAVKAKEYAYAPYSGLKINPMGHQIVLKELLFLKLYQKEKRIYEK